MKKSIWVIIAGLLMVVSLPLASQAAPLKKLSWYAEYYNNPSLSGHPILTRFEDQFGHNWGFGSPGPEIPVDHFSARWSRTMQLDEGVYLFILNVDDGARVWLDGQLILDAWSIGSKQKLKTRVTIDKTGDYAVQVAYFENTGKAYIDMEWIKLGDSTDFEGAWTGQYYNNKHLDGEPSLVRQDAAIKFDWNSGSPSARIARDNFSVRWTRSVYLETGRYTFRVQHDDGMRVYIDGKIIYDSWFDQPVSYEVGIVPIKEGYRTLTVEYYDHVGNAVAYFNIDEDPGNYDDYVPDPNEPAVYVDNKDSGFKWYGPDPYVKSGGFGGNFLWTPNKNNTVQNSAIWKPHLPEPGNYEVLVYIPPYQASTKHARYFIQHFGRVKERALDQSFYNAEFASLGIYYFDAQGNEFVKLIDATGEAPGSTQVAFDAVKFLKK